MYVCTSLMVWSKELEGSITRQKALSCMSLVNGSLTFQVELQASTIQAEDRNKCYTYIDA